MNKTHWYPGVMTPIRTGWYECHYANTAKDQESGAVVMRLWEPNSNSPTPTVG